MWWFYVTVTVWCGRNPVMFPYPFDATVMFGRGRFLGAAWQVIHGESFVVAVGPNDSVRWMQQEASAIFSRRHNFSTHVVQVSTIF